MGASLLALAKFIYYIYSENGWAGLVTHREYRLQFLWQKSWAF